jgi:hypothetical protein
MNSYARWKDKERRDLEHFREWIHAQPCVVCGRHSPEGAHVGLRGLSNKCSDTEMLPLCGADHAEQHKDRYFWAKRGLAKETILDETHLRYLEEVKRRSDLVAKFQNAVAYARGRNSPIQVLIGPKVNYEA